MMFEFAAPWMIALLPLPLLVWILTSSPRGQGQADAPEIIFPHIGRLKTAFAGQFNDEQKTNWLFHVFIWLAWLCLVFALMQPQLTDQYTKIKNKGHDLMLAVDLSGSMRATDLGSVFHPVNRLDVVKNVLGKFVLERGGDRVGLILFGTHAYLDVPLTPDIQAVGKMIENTMIGEAGDSTAIGDALGVAVGNLRSRPGNAKVIILLTDGADNSSSIPPLQAAQLAKQYKIRVYTIGVGSSEINAMPGLFAGLKSDLDEELLQKIADMTEGRYFRATDEKALENIYRSIDELEKTEDRRPAT